MNAEYKLCWHDNVVYKLKFVWPTESSKLPRHEMLDTIQAVVKMARTGPILPKVSTDLCIVEIHPSPWRLNQQMHFQRGNQTYKLHHLQFGLHLYKKWTKPPKVSYSADSSSSDGALEPTPQRTKRSARKHWDTPSQCLSLVPKRQRTDEELELPFAVQECIRRLRRSDVEQRFTITSHNVPDVVCRKINRLSASEGAGNHSTIIILDGSALAMAPNPVGAVKFTEFPPHGGNGPSRGLLGFVGRMLSAPFSYISKWFS
ncbi:uncharacterized protein LOC115331646 [Ixodes scapularis]|uniref:uncharacterized protein LOC115331646 n=1 Tax=Ixodes scapularis TaxID=6945 RepID=UPI001A9DE1CC|nr:uncharacterized protein LOC115331646 [Ixodes scapularis]